MTQPKVYKPSGATGGDEIVVASGGKITVESGGIINVKTGGIIKANGTQAAAIADISETEAVFSAAEREKFNDILAALRGAGIIVAE
jgi:hypothetical protein